MKLTVDIQGAKELHDRLIALGVEASKSGGPVKNAVRYGANVIRDEMRRNMAAAIADPNVSPEIYESTGKLMKSIKSSRAPGAKQTVKGETYIVGSITRAKYANGMPVKRVAGYLEYGTKNADGSQRIKEYHPLRSAWASKKDEALKVMMERLEKGIAAIEKKVSKS